MDPISFSVELELGAVLLAVVGALATWVASRRQKALLRQRERHHQEKRAQNERHHREHIAVMRADERILAKAEDVRASRKR
jgi:hypothetical protein